MYEKKSNVFCKSIPDAKPKKSAMAKICQTNAITEIKVVEKVPHNLNRYQKIGKSNYLDKETGEIKTYQFNSLSHKSKLNMNRAYTTLRQIINENFTCKSSEVHIILTYSNPPKDRKQIIVDFKKFWKNLKYHHNTMEYILIPEPNASGAWHLHVLVKDNKNNYLFLEQKEIKALWRHGSIKIRRIKKNNNIGAYFCRHFKNLPSDPAANEEDGKDTKKGRLCYYPPNCKLYSCSREIKKPAILKMSYGEAQKLVQGQTPSYSKTLAILSEEEGTETEVNRIYYEQYNKKK